MSHKNAPSGWDKVATWYNGWVGKDGSEYHRNLAIPAILELLNLQSNQKLLDIGCGTGVLAPYVAEMGADYTGIDISPKLIQTAKRYHSDSGEFFVMDARKLKNHLPPTGFDACAFLLSIQDMNPLETVLHNAAYLLGNGAVLAILMTHPCFRIPRQSGWGYDEGRKLQYRRVDSYLSTLKIPMKQHKEGTTISFHRPLSAYINALSNAGFLVDKLDEITTYPQGKTKAERRADNEIPIFMALRARKIPERN